MLILNVYPIGMSLDNAPFPQQEEYLLKHKHEFKIINQNFIIFGGRKGIIVCYVQNILCFHKEKYINYV